MKKTKMVVGFCKDIFIYTYWLLSNMILWIVFFSFMFQNPPVYFSPSNLLTQQLTHEAFDVEDMKWKHETFYVEAMHYCYPWRSPSLIALPRLCGNNVSCNMWRNYTTHSGRLTIFNSHRHYHHLQWGNLANLYLKQGKNIHGIYSLYTINYYV